MTPEFRAGERVTYEKTFCVDCGREGSDLIPCPPGALQLELVTDMETGRDELACVECLGPYPVVR